MQQSKGGDPERISVVVPRNPFSPPDLANAYHLLCALDVVKLMEWWPGLPHVPKRDPMKAKAIQRALDWKRVAQIASYLLQQEIQDIDKVLDEVFDPVYEPRKNDPGREWPPQVRGTVKYTRSSFPFFSNVLVHVNGGEFEPSKKVPESGELVLDPNAEDFYLTVIDGQHRINGAYLALKLLHKSEPAAEWLIPAEVFLNLDPINKPPVHQAQIFIDVNLNQKKVDRSLVADLFPLARGRRQPLDVKERSQDIGRRLMLETGPLVGMIQIPGIRYGVKDVVALATLNSGIEGVIPSMDACDLSDIESQTTFLSQVLECWLNASGRMEAKGVTELDRQNVVYQGRVLVSMLGLTPAIIFQLREKGVRLLSEEARSEVTNWLRGVIGRAGLTEGGKFVSKDSFKKLGFLGSGGIGRFRDRLWAAAFTERTLSRVSEKRIAILADGARRVVNNGLHISDD